MGLSKMDIEILRYAGLLHDIGKIGVPELILLKDKRPTEDEFQIIKRHAGLTRSILGKIHFPGELKKIVDMAATHHEKLNGTGYPDGLKGDEIPRGGKILAVCDVFDSLSSRRTYEDRLPIKTVVNVLDDEVSEAFEPFIVYHFKNVPLDRIVQIMEYGHTAIIDDKDIEYLKNFTLNDLINADKIKSDEQQKMFNIFNKYYSRQYRG
jgi:HD-GYP domain-containing protein (c-di-GMP phosphodiesterase class II)